MREHGSHVRYVHGPDIEDRSGKGCRCEACRQANRDYERERSQRVEPPYVGAGPARAHIAWLAEQGVGLKQVARRSGLAHGTLSKLVYGDHQRGTRPSKRIRRTTFERILAVMPSEAAQGARVPAGPVWADIDELLRRGWTKVAIAKAIGQTNGTGLQLGRQSVTRRNATAIHALLDQPTPARRDRHGNVTPSRPAPGRTRREITERRQQVAELTNRLAETLEVRIEQAGWRRSAACRGRPTWMWFPARGDSETLEAALRICSACIVRVQCLQAHWDEPDGVFGGLPAGRRKQRRLRRGRATSTVDREEAETG